MIGYTNSVGNVYSENLKGTTMGKIIKAFKDNFDSTMVKRGIAAIIAGAILVWFFYFNGTDLKAVCEEYRGEWYCTIAEDGSYIYVDTDPLDFGDYIEDGSLDAIEDINEELGFPDSVYAQMTNTRAIDGTMTYEKNGVSVSWTYHPDSGLEVIYSAE